MRTFTTKKKITRQRFKEFITPYATSERVLDIGSGREDHESLFPNRVTLDVNKDHNPDVVGDAHHLPFPDNSFSVVVCCAVLPHVKNPQEVVNEMHRVLEPGGMLILSTTFVYPLTDSPYEYWRFTKYGLDVLLGTGWEMISMERDFGPFTTIGVLIQRITYQTQLRGGKFTKLCIYALAHLLSSMDFLVKKTYGDIGRIVEDPFFFSSGIYSTYRKVK